RQSLVRSPARVESPGTCTRGTVSCRFPNRNGCCSGARQTRRGSSADRRSAEVSPWAEAWEWSKVWRCCVSCEVPFRRIRKMADRVPGGMQMGPAAAKCFIKRRCVAANDQVRCFQQVVDDVFKCPARAAVMRKRAALHQQTAATGARRRLHVALAIAHHVNL